MRLLYQLSIPWCNLRCQEDRGTGFKGEVGEEVLCLRAYGECYMSLGLGVRYGSAPALTSDIVFFRSSFGANVDLRSPLSFLL